MSDSINLYPFISADISAFEIQYLSADCYSMLSIQTAFKNRYVDLTNIYSKTYKLSTHDKKYDISVIQTPLSCINKLDKKAVKLLTNNGSIDAGNLKIVNCAEPEADTDAATKNYVVQKLDGLFLDSKTMEDIDGITLSCIEDNNTISKYDLFVSNGQLSVEKIASGIPMMQMATSLRSSSNTDSSAAQEEIMPKRRSRKRKTTEDITV